MKTADTKERIIHRALNLFAEHGYDGTSIRNLAKEADVNIAAINYHFENKSNLYYSVIKLAHQKMSENVSQAIAKKEWEPEDLLVEIFDRFLADGPMLVAVFKIFLSSAHEVHERLCSEKGFEGPPGAFEIAQVFQEKHPGAKREDLFFVVRTLFSQMIHYAVVAASLGEHAKKKISDFKGGVGEMREDLRRATSILRATLH